MDPPRSSPITPMLTWPDEFHRVCRRKSRQTFSGKLSTEIFTGSIRFPVENRCGARPTAAFSHIPNGPVVTPCRRRPPPVAGSHADRLRPVGRLGYPSRVCSIMGDAIDRIVEAIDQLACDAQGESGEAELAARVADLWLMVSALDPELARRKQGYTKPADGAPPG